MDIRTLRADEIEVRVQQVSDKEEATMLLYKDARCDMRILDEVFQVDGWKREHQLIDGKLFCTVSIWSDRLSQWITKQDVGTESMAEKEKGQASDSFKRACFNLGIGRELYSSPHIKIDVKGDTYTNSKTNKKALSTWVKFRVSEIGYDDKREISRLIIVDQNNRERYRFENGAKIESKKYSTSKQVSKADTVDSKGLLNKEEKERLFMTAKGLETPIVKEILGGFGFDNSSQVTSCRLDDLCKALENAKNVNSKFRERVVKELIKDARNI